MQAGRVETGQPHVAHDHDLEWVLGVFETVRQLAALKLASDMLLPLGTVLGAAGHHDFENRRTNFRVRSLMNELGSSFYVSVLPLRTQLDQCVVEVHATEGGKRADRDRQHAVLGEARPSGAARESNASAHADDHRLAIHRLQELLKMRRQVGGHERDAFRIAHQRLQCGQQLVNAAR